MSGTVNIGYAAILAFASSLLSAIGMYFFMRQVMETELQKIHNQLAKNRENLAESSTTSVATSKGENPEPVDHDDSDDENENENSAINPITEDTTAN